MDKRQFLESVYACRRRLNLAGFLNKSVFALSVGAIAGILFQAAAFVVPFYYANLYTGAALFLAVAAALAVSYIKRMNAGQAALVMDGFGFEERIVTAYENLDKEGTLIELQREDALRQLGAHRDRIHIPIMPSIRKILPLLGLLLVLMALILMPSAVKERAGELHDLREAAKETEEEIEDVLEALEELSQEELTLEQQAAIQEMMEGLQSSLSEYQQADTADMLSMAEQKLDYKYENMSSQLAELAQMLEDGTAASAAAAQSMQAVADKLKQKSEKELAANSQNQDSENGQDSQGSNDSRGSGSGDGQNKQNGSGSGEDGQGSQKSGAGQGGQDSQGGQGGDGQGSQGSQSGSGEGGSNGQDSQSGNGEGGSNGQDSQSGNGEGDGQSSQGGNSEDGSGNGRGTGSSSTPHDYVSVPNAIADSGNLSGNAVDHDASEYFRAQSGLSWEGMHISHEAVIGSYEQNAYEGIAAGRYPSGMEDVIKQYFSSFN